MSVGAVRNLQALERKHEDLSFLDDDDDDHADTHALGQKESSRALLKETDESTHFFGSARERENGGFVSNFHPMEVAGGTEGASEDEIDIALMKRPSSRHTWSEVGQLYGLAGPLCAMNLVWFSRFIITLAFLGRLGKLQLAAGAMGIAFANVTGYSVLIGMATGMEPLCCQANGAGCFKQMGLTLQRTMLLLLCTSLPISVTWFFSRDILLYFGQDRALVTEASSFILFLLPDLIATAFVIPLRIFFRSQVVVRPLFTCCTIALAVHVLLSFILVLGLGWGMPGAALAASGSNWVLAALLVLFLHLTGLQERSWQPWSQRSFQDWGPLVRMAIPSCLMICLEWWCYEILMLLAGLLPDATVGVATLAILFNCDSIVFAFNAGIAAAACTRIGNLLGENSPVVARFSYLVSLSTSALVGLATLAFFWLANDVIGSVFSTDPQVLQSVSSMLPLFGVLELFNAVQTCMGGVLRGSARPAVGAYINFASFYVVALPLALFLCFGVELGLIGLVLGLLAGVACCCFMMLVAMVRTDWRSEAERLSSMYKTVGYCGDSDSGQQERRNGQDTEVEEEQQRLWP